MASHVTAEIQLPGSSKAPEKLQNLLISPSDVSVYKRRPSHSGLRLYFYPSETQLEL